MDDRPKGLRFTHVYMRPEECVENSPKARFRIAEAMQDHVDGFSPTVGLYQKYIQRRMGIDISSRYSSGVNWRDLAERITLPEFLDLITIFSDALYEYKRPKVKPFLDECVLIFREEAISFEIDEHGGIHPLVDDAYHMARKSAVRGLLGTRYSATLSQVEQIDNHIMASPPDYIMAIRSVFGANENLFKLMCGTPRLDKRSAKDKLGIVIDKEYSSHSTMKRASHQILNSFGEWVDSAHHYRHEQGVEKPNQPDEDLAIVIISQGLTFVRWLSALDKRTSSD